MPGKTGLVMEGGAMRGMFTCGILDCWMDHGVTVDAAIGVSAGAVFGCNLKSHQRGRALRYNMRFCNDPRYVSVRSLLTSGDIYNVDFCYRRVPFELDVMDWETFSRDPMAFYVVCTDALTGEPVCHLCTGTMEEELVWLRASASMPLVSRTVDVEGRPMLDGGIADSIPLAAFERLGFTHNIVILTQPEGFVKAPNPLVPAARVLLRRYPKLVDALATRHVRYNAALETVRDRERDGSALVLRPPEALGISNLEKDPRELQRVWRLGYDLAEKRLEEVRAFLARA